MTGNLSRDTLRKFAIIRALEELEKPSLQNISEETDIPVGTVKRQLTAIRTEFKVHILFIRDPTEPRGASGYYSLVDWGIIDRDEFLRHFGGAKQ